MRLQGVLDWMKFNNSQSSLSLKRVLEAVMQQMRKAPAEELHTAFQVRAPHPLHSPSALPGISSSGAEQQACLRAAP